MQQAEIRQFAEDWIERNQEKVIRNHHISDLTILFNEIDRSNFENMNSEEIDYLKHHVNNVYRSQLLNKVGPPGPAFQQGFPTFGIPPTFGRQPAGPPLALKPRQSPMVPYSMPQAYRRDSITANGSRPVYDKIGRAHV